MATRTDGERSDGRGARGAASSRKLTLAVSTWAFSPSLAGRRRPSRGCRRPSPDVRCSRLASLLLLLSSGHVSLSKMIGSASSFFYQYLLQHVTHCILEYVFSLPFGSAEILQFFRVETSLLAPPIDAPLSR